MLLKGLEPTCNCHFHQDLARSVDNRIPARGDASVSTEKYITTVPLTTKLLKMALMLSRQTARVGAAKVQRIIYIYIYLRCNIEFVQQAV